MAVHTKSIVILVVIVTISYQSHFAQAADPAADIVAKVPTDSWTDFWIVRLSLNILGYGSVCLPAWLVIRYIKRSGYLERGGETGHGCMFKSIRMCVTGDEEKPSIEDGGVKTSSPEAPKVRVFLL